MCYNCGGTNTHPNQYYMHNVALSLGFLPYEKLAKYRGRRPGTSLVPRPFFPIIEREGEGEKRPGIHCTGGSARALNC